VSRTLVWSGLDAPRMEVAHVEQADDGLRAAGTQIGETYELRYELVDDRLRLELVGARRTEVELDGCDFFDLAFSPLFNSLPVLRDGLLEGGDARDYVMRFVDVPELKAEESEQRYEPLGERRVRFRSGTFAADLEFDGDGFVVRYEGLAQRVG
jgi:uncharacterized protein